MLVTFTCLQSSAAAQIEVELTFDDGPDGSGPSDGLAIVNNLESKAKAFGEGAITATLTGEAHRSAIDAGRYGRAADLANGALDLSPWVAESGQAIYLWLAPRDTTTGAIVSHADSWDLHFEDGALVVGAYRSDGTYATFPAATTWPSDSAFHHFTILLDADGGSPRVTVAIDAAAGTPVTLDFVPRSSSAPLRFGEGLDGLIDELLIKSSGAPSAADRFDRDPTQCPDGTECIEEVITLVPREFTHEIPVRFKSVYVPSLCTEATPCPLVIDVSGGNDCADDYDQPNSVAALAEAGFVVVTVDLYCEADGNTKIFPHETSQLIAVKDYVLSDGALRDLIEGDDYAATGCSHGAGTVALWSMKESDFPARTYSRSTGGAGLCPIVADQLCPQVLESRLATLGVSSIDEVDREDPLIQEAHSNGDLVGLITEEVTATREVARSWGVNSEGPVCREDGSFACDEEGLWAMTYSSRRFANLWQRTQAEGAPSGYFVEDLGADCRHCAPANSEAFRCGVCMLRHGRAGMDEQCPECLTYDDPTIGPSPAADPCPMDASWYEDPLAATDEPLAPGGDASGCGCTLAPSRSRHMGLAWLAAVALVLTRRREETT